MHLYVLYVYMLVFDVRVRSHDSPFESHQAANNNFFVFVKNVQETVVRVLSGSYWLMLYQESRIRCAKGSFKQLNRIMLNSTVVTVG